MEAQLQELFQFLHDRNPQVRQLALSNLLGHTPAGSLCRSIFFTGMQGSSGLRAQPVKDTEIVRDLKLLCRDRLAIAHDAFRALVNLTDSPLWINALSDQSFLIFLVSYILHPPSILADLAAMLLSNLSAQQSVCTQLISLKVPVVLSASLTYHYYPTQSRSATSTPPTLNSESMQKDLDALPLLVDAFASSAKVTVGDTATPSTRKGELHFLSSVFANLSVTPVGRTFFLTPIPAEALILSTSKEGLSGLECPLSRLTAFTEHADTIRRGGVASVIKNCSFYKPAHRALLSPEDEQIAIPPSQISAPGINILPPILLPLAGPEEMDLEVNNSAKTDGFDDFDAEQIPPPLQDQEKLPPLLQFLPPTKKRETDSAIRLIFVEALLLLCTTRWGRNFLRENGTYEIIKLTHENETVDKISEHIERLVNLLKRDESHETVKDDMYEELDDDSEDERIEEV